MLSDHSFNCQMGRGRTTTGMVAASLIATVASEDTERLLEQADGEAEHESGEMAESKQYLNGEWRGLCVMLRGSRESKPLWSRGASPVHLSIRSTPFVPVLTQ